MSIFYPAKMFGKSFVGQSFCFALAAFIPTNPPALDILSFIYPYLSHNIESIVSIKGQIKRKNGQKKCKIVSFWRHEQWVIFYVLCKRLQIKKLWNRYEWRFLKLHIALSIVLLLFLIVGSASVHGITDEARSGPTFPVPDCWRFL